MSINPVATTSPTHVPNGQTVRASPPAGGSIAAAFDGPTGTFVIDGLSGSVALDVTNFAPGDTIEVTGAMLGLAGPPTQTGTNFSVDYALDNAAGVQIGDLQLTIETTAAIALRTSEVGTTFAVAQACYAAGTRILTTRGEIPVEGLRVGDEAITAHGDRQAIVWLGHRRVDCRRHPRPSEVWPVRVRADAFGRGRPSRDLLLSPDHAVYAQRRLIPVRYLVNGASVAQEPCNTVTYWHVELPCHAVLLAEGLPAESYLDTANRSAFANGGPAVMAHPDFVRAVWEREGCAKLALSGPAVAAVRRRLLSRLPELGWTLTDEPALHLFADGHPVRARRHGPWLFLALPQGAEELTLRSRAAAPAETDPTSEDCRRLGVALQAWLADDARQELDDPRLTAGWHPIEGSTLRWTSGDACIDVRGIRVIALSLATSLVRYPVPTKPELSAGRAALRA